MLDLIFTKYLVTKIRYQKFIRIDKYPYLKEAIREAVYNAIVHRNYATHIPTQIRVYRDKLIISNSCILPYGWTVESMPEQHTSKPYNPLIANVFYRAGNIESWGRGIQNIYKNTLLKELVHHKKVIGRFSNTLTSSNLIKKVGRNDPCPCGSGKKYKKCCWKTK